MNCYLLLAEPREPGASARAVAVQLQLLQTSPGGQDITVSFQPNRADDLFASAKEAAQLAYRILFREGLVRSQLAARWRLSDPPANVVGRSADLSFALTILLTAYEERGGRAQSFPAIAATGALDTDGAVRAVDHIEAKLHAALRQFRSESAKVFFPAQNLVDFDAVALAHGRPNVEFVAIEHLDEALERLGIVLERIYLRNPYRGLAHFDYEHHSIFFGRDPEVRELMRQLLRRESAGVPGVLVEGPSGSGKSSFLRAGVLPALVEPADQPQEVQDALRARPVSSSVRHAIWRPGLMPVGTDELGMLRSICECWAALPELGARLRVTQIETLTQLAVAVRELWPPTVRFVWLIDQLEEIFTLGLPETLLEALGHFLGKLQSDGAWTLASIRADAMPQFKSYDALRHVFGANEGQYYLATLQGLALDDVIVLPARAADLTFGVAPDGRRLDQLLREEAYRERDSLPPLQFTLNELYLKRSGRQLEYGAYQQLGGLSGSIATTAEAILKDEAAASPRTAACVFRFLVSVDETGRAVRRYAPIAEVTRDARQKALLLRLVNARLCVTDRRDGEPVVAFAHDSLLVTLPALTEWLKEEGGLLQTRELAERDTRLWQEHGQSDAWLAPADKVAAFRALDAAGVPTAPEVQFFVDRSERQVRRTERVKRTAVAVIAILAVVASLGTWTATRKQREAENQTARAHRAQLQLLTEAAAERLKDGDLIFARGILLEVLRRRAVSETPDPAAISVLEDIRASDPALAIFTGHRGVVRRLAYSPDGSRIVTASGDGTARIWDARTGIQLQVLDNTTGVSVAGYSPDGSQILTASRYGPARIWDAHNGSLLLTLKTPDKVSFATYSRDGSRIVTSSSEGLQIWDARSGTLLRRFRAQPEGTPTEGFLPAAVFSPDGSRLVATALDRTARVWNARTGAQLAVLSGHRDTVISASYSPDGQRILTCSYDSTARIWDAHSGAQLITLAGPRGFCFGAAYSPDGKTIATALGDKTARIWDAATGRPLRVFSGHVDIVGDAAFSPDGTELATSGWDGTVRTWSLRDGGDAVIMSGHGNQVQTVGYSPDGSHLVTASSDGTARIWDANTGSPVRVLSGHAGTVASAVYSPDGSRILTASDDRTARVWDARTGDVLLSMTGPDRAGPAVYSPDGTRVLVAYADFTFDIHDASTGMLIRKAPAVHRNFISTAVYSPDATRILTGSMDKTARIWDAKTLTQIAALPHKDVVNQAVYSPDGKLIVTVSCDSLAHLWDAGTGAELRVLAGHHAYVYSVAFSPDGTRIITGSDDQTIRLWDTRSGIQLGVLLGHGARVQGLSYSPDGRHIASASVDATARIWDATVPADWNTQVIWEQSVEADLLSDVQRTQLGIPSTLASLTNSALRADDERDPQFPVRARTARPCSQQAGAYYDPNRETAGVEQTSIVAEIAVAACVSAAAQPDPSGQLAYHAGRALVASGDFAGARRQFEAAVTKGYRAACVDLARLFIDPAAQMLDSPRAVSLFTQAWETGIPLAAFELGHMYEHGVRSRGDARFAFEPDPSRAWFWYGEAAQQNEPNSLGRLAERAETEAITGDPSKRDVLLLEAFTNYARAAERARAQQWPDGAWKAWRYRRSTLARILAGEGLMQQAADAFKRVLDEKQT